MRIKGKLIGAPKPRPCVIERENEQFVFTISAVLDYKEFDELCPTPKPPKALKPGGKVTVNTDSPRYLEALTKYSEKKTSWLLIQAISDTDGLEWERVDLQDPETWSLYMEELKGSGLTEGEIAYLINQVYEVNSLDESKMTEARERFISSQEAGDK